MPTVLRSGPYRFFFYSADGSEAPHVHVERGARTAVFWLDPVRMRSSGGMGAVDLAMLTATVQGNVETMRRCWDEFFAH